MLISLQSAFAVKSH